MSARRLSIEIRMTLPSLGGPGIAAGAAADDAFDPTEARDATDPLEASGVEHAAPKAVQIAEIAKPRISDEN